MSDSYPRIRLAAAQAAPVFLDGESTIDKACRIILEAGAGGADLVAFPEGFIPGHPLWFGFHVATSRTSMELAAELFDNAIVVPSPATDRLCDAARSAATTVVIGLCEKEAHSMGTMFNSQLVIGRDGSILGGRRKLVPTLAERIVHSQGDGAGVRVFASEFGAISALMCGENSNPLLTFAMQALGARIHIASWPNFFSKAIDLQAIADIAGRAIAYQNACYVVNALGAVSEQMIERLAVTDADRAYLHEAAERGGSAIYEPGGQVVAGPMAGGEGILYADADLARIVPRKIVHDYAGDYNRFDIFQLTVNVAPAAAPIRTDAGDVLRLMPAPLPAAAAVQAGPSADGSARLPKRVAPTALEATTPGRDARRGQSAGGDGEDQ